MFFAALAAVSLTWSLFHLAFLIAAGLILVGTRHRIRDVALVAAIPLLAVASWSAKNLSVYGTFSASTWLGMNLANVTTMRVPDERRNELVATGKLSRLAEIPPFSNVRRYRPEVVVPSRTGIPLLDMETKSTGFDNLHHRATIEISQRYLDDAIAVVRMDPMLYVRSVGMALLVFSRPPSDHVFFDENGNRAAIRTYQRLIDQTMNGQLHGGRHLFVGERFSATAAEVALSSGLFALLAIPASTVYALKTLRDRRSTGLDPATVSTIAFMVLSIGWLVVFGCAIDLGENNRFRFVVEPLIWILFLLMLSDLGSSRQDRSP